MEQDRLRVDIDTCKKAHDEVICTFLVTNRREAPIANFELTLTSNGSVVSYLIDNLGNQYPATVLKLGSHVAENNAHHSTRLTLEPDLPVKGSLIASKVLREVSNVSLSLVYFDGIGGGWHRITVRNVPLTD